jgi:2-C-methyl-D-erythritol 2,4-cyclodiphosphate synthase
VLTHAVIDALLGAAGAGDLGSLFPSEEERWHDADSLDLLRVTLGSLPGPVLNVDATVIAEEPALGPHRGEMERNLAAVLSAPVSVKATTNDGMGAIGRGEGIACVAVALLDAD